MTQGEQNYTSQTEELRKYKQLLDEGVITEEEFETKKQSILQGENKKRAVVAKAKVNKKNVALKIKRNLKKIYIALGIVVVLVIGYFVGVAIVDQKQTAAIEDAVAHYLAAVGIQNYEIEYERATGELDIYPQEALKKSAMLALIVKCENMEPIENPCGKRTLSIRQARLHPSDNDGDYYYRVSSVQVAMNKMYGGNYRVPGLYYSVGMTCVWEEKN